MVLLFLLAFCRLCSFQTGFCRVPFQFECFILGLFLWPFFCLAVIVSVFVLSSVPSGSFNSECFLWCVFSYTFLYPALFLVLFRLAFPNVSLLLVSFLGVVYMSQPVAGWFHTQMLTGGKQAQDPPGSLHSIVSPVEWSSFKGTGPRRFTVWKTTCFTKMPLVCVLQVILFRAFS